jgi:hypothetical protein
MNAPVTPVNTPEHAKTISMAIHVLVEQDTQD